ncbi:uncharacterized protein LOC113777888 isoform X2 [Coffea eugenioides]|uniref:Uncharacterized protein LOC113697900 isoform X2 n=1 Tax=Coffea arabica TaxID=13443 RepID=A0A6P6T4U8_COFAR|nr:uncharacterized protein LOC113697900 isoform X2 [Coffea arabica]XP_027178919.1 uncharacterized protein LOC113777888 isoform X2 [Coffea eugenioides]
MASAMEPSLTTPIGSRRRDESEFNLNEWALKARISRENTSSRRFSASNIRSFREDARSFRSNITISSTASSPGYTLREEIDPSTYSFTNALKALQAKTVYSWEHLSPDGLALNSKWNEAEKYICNPLSGEVPLECLSAKTLSARSFRNLASRITMSAPLIYPTHSRQYETKPAITIHEDEVQIQFQEKKMRSMSTRDIGTQSTPPDFSSDSPSPAPTPSIEERSIKRSDSPVSSEKIKSDVVGEVKETSEEEEETKRNGEGNKTKAKQQVGCLSWSLWKRRRQREKHKAASSNKKKNVLVYCMNGCQKRANTTTTITTVIVASARHQK